MNDMIMDIENTDILAAVRESAVLADVSISVWGGTKTDPKLLNELKDVHGATGDVGKVVKNLLAGADSQLKITRSAFLAVRLRHYALTLPWVSDPHATRQEGPRLLPHLIFDRYMVEITGLRRQAMEKLDEFLDAYPQLVEQARENLGTMANMDSYPSVDALKGAFRINVDFTPVPESARFRGLSDFTLERLAKHLSRKQERQVAQAQRAVWERAEKPLRNLIERLTDESFRERTFDNVKELIALLVGWNITNDPSIAATIQELEDMAGEMDSKNLRKNANARDSLIRKARAVADKMASHASADAA